VIIINLLNYICTAKLSIVICEQYLCQRAVDHNRRSTGLMAHICPKCVNILSIVLLKVTVPRNAFEGVS
jgi:hypothetical protein